MRTLRYLTLLSLLLAAFAVVASAQKRKTTPRPTPKPTPTRTPTSTFEASLAKQQVAIQLHNVNVFVERMGPIAVAFETLDKDAAARRLKQSEIDAHNANKQKMVVAIRGIRDGLVKLETDFRARPALAQYLPRIQGISALSAQSEDHAIAGRFVAAKEPLRQVALKLNETLAVMPGQVAPGNTTTASPNRNIPVSTSTPSGPTTSARRDPAMGMTPDQVLQSSWGAPANKRTSRTSTGTTEVWSYPGTRTVYFYNGKVSRIVP